MRETQNSQLNALDLFPGGPSKRPDSQNEKIHWLRDPNNKFRFEAMRRQALRILKINSEADVTELIYDEKLNNEGEKKRKEEKRRKLSQDAYARFGKTYGIKGPQEAIESQIDRYAMDADIIINKIRSGPLKRLRGSLELSNGVKNTTSIVDLFITFLNEKYDDKTRFEAGRKLWLMKRIAAVDHRIRELKMKDNFKNFSDFLDNYVYSPDVKSGKLQEIYVLSTHNPDDNACLTTKIISKEEGDSLELGEFEKLTELGRRKIHIDVVINGKRIIKDIYAYVGEREKTIGSATLKSFRKDEENPAIAVEDDIGAMFVVDDTGDVKLLIAHLSDSVVESGSEPDVESPEDRLGKPRQTKNPSSAPQLRQLKYFMRLDGIRVEIIMHTNKTYIDYKYRDGMSHDEYEVIRLYQAETPWLFWPYSIYGVNFAEQYPRIINIIREDLRRTKGEF